MKTLLLHHSTGEIIWNGRYPTLWSRIAAKLRRTLGWNGGRKPLVETLFRQHNRKHGTNYEVESLAFPKAVPYGWHNYPFDYYNLWVRHAGTQPFLNEPTLELLTREYQVILFKHCFPVSNVQPDRGSSDINSDYKCLGNYKCQYQALRQKLQQFPETKFIAWTGAAQVRSRTNQDEAKRAREFFDWVVHEWDEADDNIYLWDFYGLQTQGELFFNEEFAVSPDNPHPNSPFAARAARLLYQRIVDVVETNGAATTLVGNPIPPDAGQTAE